MNTVPKINSVSGLKFYGVDLLKLFECFNFFRMRGDVHRDAFAVADEVPADVARNSFGETPSSTSSASVLISIF